MARYAFLLLAALLTACASTAPGPSGFVSNRIAVRSSGSGPDVILVAGAGALGQQVWGGTTQRVPGYRYHVVQVAGFAGTPAGANADGPVVEPIADELSRYIAEQRLRRPAIVGLSMGGNVALALAARHPDDVGRVMVVDMIPFMGAFFGPPGRIAGVGEARPIAEKVREAMLAEDPATRRRNMAASVDKMVRTPALRPEVLEHGMASDPRVMANVMHDMIGLDLRPQLANLRVPVRVLYVQSPLISLDVEQTDAVYRRMYAGLPTATLKRIEGAYHFIMLDQPEVFARELGAFLADSGQSTAQ